jgi:hypothetical protein
MFVRTYEFVDARSRSARKLVRTEHPQQEVVPLQQSARVRVSYFEGAEQQALVTLN